ncbi:colicin-like bacteriocin tRNase domain-containing protein [Serratia sp. CY52157]|uniref:colicin-like bacteriocin tRNase domain-containing protein n=2 Tax=Serratia TaxID=613 RepID=UPI0013DA1FCC|nr:MULTISPECIES: colicin-like bacteriocin tRNase domain-containing protein [Serratia]MBH2720829.1 S-type pyocin domain-containing protein [Serratia ureilytica]MBH3095479.1 S-type pyocin domain-containing protein [Serratia ureilytica]MBH3319612.1 S-type pyocin domain-containing protein [Serratia ureilytica]MBJ2104889.1 S-type pyocin domain-containing protein [Serratia ureilytica]MBZ0048012.1 S-type pyocin domain-containing protein [Serratia sp. EWG9]
MSGGDGKDSRGPGGGVNGGPTGLGGGVDASDHSGWSSENNPWGGKDKDTGGHTGGGNNGGDRDPANSGGNVNLSLFPEAQASVAVGAQFNLSLIDGAWGFSLLKSQTVQSFITKSIAKVKTLGIPTVGTLWRTSLWGLVVEGITPTKIAPDDMSMVRHITTTLPADLVTQTPPGQLPTQPATLVSARIADLVDEGQQKVAVVRSPSLPMSVPVVEAKPTKRPDVYTVGIVPGMPDIHIRVNAPAPPTTAKPVDGVTEINNAEAKPLPATQPGGNTHDGIVVFPPGSNLPPAYVAVVEIIPQNEVNAREAERKALLTYQDARQRRESVQTDEYRKSHSYQWLLPELTINQRQIEEKQSHIALNQRIAERQTIQEANARARRQAGRAEQFHRDVERTNGTIAALNEDLSRLRQEEKDLSAQVAEFDRIAKDNMSKIRARQPTDKDIASLSPQAQAAFWRNQAKKEFVLTVGDGDLPKYPPVMGSKPSPLFLEQPAYFWRESGFAISNYNSVAATETLETGIRGAFARASAALTKTPAEKLYNNGQVTTAEFAQLSFVFSESLDVPALSVMSSLGIGRFGLTRDDVRNALGNYNSVRLPYRLVSRDTGDVGEEKIHINIVRPDERNVKGAVPLRPLSWDTVKRELRFTTDDGAISLTWTPADDKGVSGYIITVTPVGAPAGKLSTGGRVDVSGKGTLVALPNGDVQQIHDYILVPPVESGLEPIYVMFNKPRKKPAREDKPELIKPREGTQERGHKYHPAPKTDEIKGLGELKVGRPKTPKQSGGGRRARWYGDKGRKIYEWDSQHGELEGYRASDGEHLGAFDPKTGKQLKSPDPKRNIKKYL